MANKSNKHRQKLKKGRQQDSRPRTCSINKTPAEIRYMIFESRISEKTLLRHDWRERVARQLAPVGLTCKAWMADLDRVIPALEVRRDEAMERKAWKKDWSAREGRKYRMDKARLEAKLKSDRPLWTVFTAGRWQHCLDRHGGKFDRCSRDCVPNIIWENSKF
ncbi:hypothetical protein K490DRAFT_59180 [Saccharata proteae CBS 121410]|uniref:Uncharacterized protein n=1 Tax=Saccharata proteae CBS 121410 TaxID=1314787 RepID=A0A9P4LUH4_9PEZI|nr:hypothetical protein K490DRAFT_59180 [Saccharata proteae CBS 121410]